MVSNNVIPLEYDAWDTFFYIQWRHKNIALHSFYIGPAGTLLCEEYYLYNNLDLLNKTESFTYYSTLNILETAKIIM